MGIPKHFRELLPLKSKPKAINKPLPIKKGLVLTPEFIEEQRLKKRIMLDFANQLRCPLCDNSQLDGEVNAKKASLYCSQNPRHFLSDYGDNKQMRSCQLRFAFENNAYAIIASFIDLSMANIVVFIMDPTMSIELQERYRKELFRYCGLLPDFHPNISEEELLDELKTSVLFG